MARDLALDFMQVMARTGSQYRFGSHERLARDPALGFIGSSARSIVICSNVVLACNFILGLISLLARVLSLGFIDVMARNLWMVFILSLDRMKCMDFITILAPVHI